MYFRNSHQLFSGNREFRRKVSKEKKLANRCKIDIATPEANDGNKSPAMG